MVASGIPREDATTNFFFWPATTSAHNLMLFYRLEQAFVGARGCRPKKGFVVASSRGMPDATTTCSLYILKRKN